jgi:hypothetical protein
LGASPDLSGQRDSIHSFPKRLSRYVSETPIATSEGDLQTILNGLKNILSFMSRTLHPSKRLNEAWKDQWNPETGENIEEILRLFQTNRNAEANGRINSQFQLIT